MAIYHLNLNVGSRSGGQSARAKSEYIEREGKYEKDSEELEYRESGNMPGWAADDPRAYWSAADEHERANGRLFVQVECSLPKELNEAEQRKLAQGFAEELTGPERLPYTLAIHKGGGENPHIHLMISERGLDGHDRDAEQWFKRANTKEPEKGGAKKTSLSSKEWLAATRQRWETAANRALDRAGSAERIDHRSLAAQREEAIERGQVERAAELSRTPRNVPGPEAHRAERGGPSRVVEVAERSERSNTEARAERAEATAQVDRAAAVFRERSEQMKAQLEALEKEIRTTRLAVLREAGRRGIAQVAEKVKAGATWIREIPRRRQEAAQEREQHKAAVERAVAAEAADRERRRGNFAAESHCREVESGRLKANEKNSKGWTPMHYAAAAGRKDIAEKLIALGAHLHDRNRNWSVPTPAEIAEDTGHHKMAGWLADGAVAEKEQWSKNMMEQSRAAFKERQEHQEKVITHGRAAFIRSLDPELSKEQTRSERELGKEWKKDNFSEAWQIERAAEAARPKQEHSQERDYGPSLDR